MFGEVVGDLLAHEGGQFLRTAELTLQRRDVMIYNIQKVTSITNYYPLLLKDNLGQVSFSV